MDIQALFYVGIIVPTIVTILVFTGFLICWFKCNLRRKVQQNAAQKSGQTPSGSFRQRLTPSIRYKVKDKYDNHSQQSNDSAIDVRELDIAFEDAEKKLKSEVVIDSKQLKKMPGHSYENERVVTEAQIHAVDLEKGSYPTNEKLRVELRSQAKIYERVEEAQMIALSLRDYEDQPANSEKSELLNAAQKQFSKPSTSGTLPRPKNPPRYTSTNKLTSALQDGAGNYAFMPGWTNKGFQPDGTLSKRDPALQQRGNNYQTSTLSWKPNITESTASNTDNYSTVEASQV